MSRPFQTVDAAWTDFANTALGAYPDSTQAAMKHIFYGGAATMLALIAPDTQETPEDWEAFILSLDTEIRRFMSELVLQ